MVLLAAAVSPDVGPGFENSPSQSGLGGRVRWLPPTTSFTPTKPGSAQRFAARVRKFPLILDVRMCWHAEAVRSAFELGK